MLPPRELSAAINPSLREAAARPWRLWSLNMDTSISYRAQTEVAIPQSNLTEDLGSILGTALDTLNIVDHNLESLRERMFGASPSAANSSRVEAVPNGRADDLLSTARNIRDRSQGLVILAQMLNNRI
jgi:hypothetical protein